MRILKFAAALIVLGLVFSAGYVMRAVRTRPPADGRRVLYYVDPMHPAYKSDAPGVAPDCGMQLEPVYADDDDLESPAAAAPRKVLYYRDPQAPAYTAAKPGLNPETGHTLEPVYEAAPAVSAHPGAIRISPERQQLIGVRFATVETGGSTRLLRTVGRIAIDETRIGHVHTRFDGWIEKVFVNFTGDIVAKGAPMLTIYSPEMLASQQELLLAVRARDLMNANPLASAAQHGESLLEAAKRRLQLWDLSDAQIQQVLRTGEPIHSVTVVAPMAGFVTERNAFPNQKVTSDSDLYTITDLSRVWILADVLEADIAAVRVGDTARVSFVAGGAAALTARVTYIQPQVDPTTRTIKVRLETPNPGMRLKPEMFVNVELGVATEPQLTIPAEALLDTGDRQTVFVDLGNGYLEPRAVVAGEHLGDRVAILKGLTAGDRIVASGTFLIDSESQLRSAAGGMGAPGRPELPAPAPVKKTPGGSR